MHRAGYKFSRSCPISKYFAQILMYFSSLSILLGFPLSRFRRNSPDFVSRVSEKHCPQIFWCSLYGIEKIRNYWNMNIWTYITYFCNIKKHNLISGTEKIDLTVFVIWLNSNSQTNISSNCIEIVCSFRICLQIGRMYNGSKGVWMWKCLYHANFKATICWIYYESAIRAVCMIFDL